MKQAFLPILFCLISTITGAQPSDSTSGFLSLRAFLSGVATYNPTARNALLLPQQAEAQLQAARGAFDPKLYSNWQQKAFAGKEYYTLGSSGVKIQSPFGLSFKSEFNTARGLYLNPEDQLPTQGQTVVGVTLPLLNGLWIDPYRADLQQARLGIPASTAQRQSRLNDLLFTAGLAYVEWAIAWEQMNIYQQATQIAEVRLRNIRESYIQGDKPAIDTLESFIQWQNRLFDLNEAQLAVLNTSQTLESFLWNPALPTWNTAGTARGKQPTAFLDTISYQPLEQLLQNLPDQHPDLQLLKLDLQLLAIDKRLALEQFKPTLNLSYNLLAKGTDFNPGSGAGDLLRDILMENYKWDMTFSFPLFLRKERGKLALVRLKEEATSNKLQQKQLEVEAKIRNYYNELQTTLTQTSLYQNVEKNYRTLLEAEQIKFDLGESSVFLINAREQKLLETQIKRIKLQGMIQKNRLALSWAAGTLFQEYE